MLAKRAAFPTLPRKELLRSLPLTSYSRRLLWFTVSTFTSLMADAQNTQNTQNTILSGGVISVSYSPGRPTSMKNTFQGELMERDVTYHVVTREEASSWIETTKNGDGCTHLLKPDLRIELNGSSFIIVTVRVEDTLKTWLENNQRNLLDPVTGDLTNNLKRILWDVLRGLKYLEQNLNRKHGNLNPSSIFVVAGGGGRLGRMRNTVMARSQDIDSFHRILDFIFPQGIPRGASGSLRRLYESLKPPLPSKSLAAFEDRFAIFYNCDCHGALLSAKEKSRFRYQALLSVRNSGGSTFRQVEYMLKVRVPGANWIQNVRNAGVGYEKVLHYNRPRPYINTPMSFLTYSRNLVEHAHQHGIVDTPDEIERKLEKIFPMCMAFFLEAVSIHRIHVDVHLAF